MERLTQSNLHGVAISASDSEHFGHNFPSTPGTNTTIVAFHNIGQQPNYATKSKSTHNARAFRSSNAGVALFAEHGLNEAKLQSPHLFSARMKSTESRSFSYITNNINEKSAAAWDQTGGTGFTLSPLFRSYKDDHGCDPTGLGRWTYVRFRGKGTTTICMISAYRPCKNKDGYGCVWNQHCRYFSEYRNLADPNPHAIFDEELLAEVRKRMNMGDIVVLGVDNNHDVRTSVLAKGLEELGLRDAVLSLHAPASPPATQSSNKRRVPIDAIWVSPSVEVTRAGYCPFDGVSTMTSDHRMLWVELDNSSILGKHLPSSRKIKASKVKSTDPRARNKYNRRVKRRYAEAKVGFQCTALQELVKEFAEGNTTLKGHIVRVYELLHKTTSDIRRDVEAHLRTLNAGEVPWSPRIQVFRDTIEYWLRVVKLRKNVNTSRKALKRLARRLHIYKGYHVGLEYAGLKLQEAYQNYYAARKNAPAWRDEHNQSLVDALVAEGKAGNSSAEQIRARMKREKNAIELGKAARAIRQRDNKHAVLKAVVTNAEGVDEELDSQDTMVQAMAESNRERQQKCLGTPSMEPLFVEDFGYLADTAAAIEVINGTYVAPEGMNAYLIELLDTMKMPDSIRAKGPLNCLVDADENRAAWKKQRENTAGEPSSLSFSHYKTASLDPDLNEIDTLLRLVPLLVSFSPAAWKIITDVEILKKAGDYRVAKMRLIQLMAPDFQINNKMIGRRILAHAEQVGEVSDDQHGSRKNHKAINTCLNKKLLCDVLRQKRRAGAVGMNDASGCYDRISHAIAILTLMSFGVPQMICRVLFQTLQEAMHHIKTGFGRSEAVYGNELIPISGIGQGNGLGPTLWALISTKLLRMMEKAGHGVHLLTSISLTALAMVGFAFVDDTDCWQNCCCNGRGYGR